MSRVVPFTKQIEISATNTEDWLNKIIEKSKEGYEIVEGTVIAYSLSKICRMIKTDDKELPIETKQEAEEITKEILTEEIAKQEPEEVVKESKIDREYIKSMEGDKNLLEIYGIEKFGINLQRNKTFKNMLKDLEEFVAG